MMGSLGRMLQIDLQRDWANLALYRDVLSFEQCFILFSSFPLLFAFVVGDLGFEFCVFVAGWRHALRSEWPFIIIIIKRLKQLDSINNTCPNRSVRGFCRPVPF